jgi:dihydroflavonol-4-reductase
VGVTRNVLELVDELGVSKAVYTSTLAVNSGTDVDESYRFEGSQIAVYDRTKWKAHYEVARPMAEDGVPVAIVQPGVIYGPGHTSDLRWVLWRAYLQEELHVVTRKSAICLDFVEDAASALALAMERSAPGEEYTTAGSGYEFVDPFELFEEITGVPAPRAISPRWFRAAAPLVAAMEPRVRPPEGLESEWPYRNPSRG